MHIIFSSLERHVGDVDIGGCAECLTQPDRVHEGIRVRRRAPVLGFHFQVFKMHWRLKTSKARHTKGTMADYVPCCDAEGNATRQHFSIDLANGFRCGASQEPRACKAGYF